MTPASSSQGVRRGFCLCAPWCKPDKALAGLTAVMWLTLYHNGSTQPVGQSFQAVPWCPGEPDQIAGGLRIWNVDDDLRIVASVTPLQLTESPALRYADDDDNLTEDEPV